MSFDWMRPGPVQLVLGGLFVAACLLLGVWNMAVDVVGALLLWFLMARFAPPAKLPVVPAVAMAASGVAVSLISMGLILATGRGVAGEGFVVVTVVLTSVLTVWLYLSVSRIPAVIAIASHAFSMLSLATVALRFTERMVVVRSLGLQVVWQTVEIVLLVLFIVHRSRAGRPVAASPAEVFD